MKSNASITSDNELIAILTPSPMTAGKREDGRIYETVPGEHPEDSSEYISSVPVTRIPFDVTALQNTHLLGKLPFGTQLTNDLLLADALERGDPDAAAEIAGEGFSDEIDFTGGKSRELSPQEKLALHICDSLGRNVRFVIWRENTSGKLRPGILCANLRQVAYALLANSLGTPGGLGVCNRCGQLFQKRRTWQPYCSANCRVAAAMKRYRERKKRIRKHRTKRGNRHTPKGTRK